MAAAILNLAGSVTGLPTGSKQIGPLQALSTAANGTVTEVTLANGANTITVPQLPAPNGCVIQLPVGNTFAVTVKGVAGDAGIAIGKTGWMAMPFDPAALPASFVLNSAGLQVAATEITFY